MTELLPKIWCTKVPKDTYRVDLITNKELKNRYGYLEYVSRADGLDRRIKLTPIERYAIIGVGISEEVAIRICEKDNDGSGLKGWWYKDYMVTNLDFIGDSWVKNPKDSLISLLKSKGLNTEDNYVFLKLND